MSPKKTSRGDSHEEDLLALAVVLLLASAAAFMYRERIGVMVAFARLKPEQSYTALPPPSAREYSNPSSWAALPDTDDAAAHA